jgi:hypothetical protein
MAPQQTGADGRQENKMGKRLVCTLSLLLGLSLGLVDGAERKVPAGYRLLVDAERTATHPGEEVSIRVRVEQLFAGSDPGNPFNYLGVGEQLVEIKKATGLRDGSIAPAEKAYTDSLGFASFKYKAGQHDRQVTIEFAHTFYIRYPRPARTFSGKSEITVTPYHWEGTISMSESMKAGEGESLISALTPGGEYDLSKNWVIRVAFKPTASYDINGTYAVEKAELLEFKDQLDQTMFRMEREGRRIEGKSKEIAKTKGRSLSTAECDLQLAVDPEKGTYFLTGSDSVKGIAKGGEDEVEINVKPINKRIDEDAEGTAGIDEEIEISGTFTPDSGRVPEELKGSKDLLADVPEEMEKFIEAMGGKQAMVLEWNLKRK